MAFCQYCGSEIPDDSKFCPNCGATQDVLQADFQPNLDMNYVQDNTLPMNWYKFLIYCALFLGAIGNAYTGIQMLTGAQYEGMASYVYAYFSSLKVIDMAMGIACIGLAVLAIIVRQKLANFKSDGPKMLLILYVANIAVSLGYVVLIMIIVGSDIVEIETIVPSLVMSMAMTFINKTYFDKRKHLFVN